MKIGCDSLESIEELFSERGKQLAGLGVLLMILGVGVVPIFLENEWVVFGCIGIGIVLWGPFVYKGFSSE